MTLLFLLLIPWVAQVSSTLFQALRQLQDEHDTIKSLETLEDEISEESLGSKAYNTRGERLILCADCESESAWPVIILSFLSFLEFDDFQRAFFFGPGSMV